MAQDHLPHYADDCCFNLDIVWHVSELNVEPPTVQSKMDKAGHEQKIPGDLTDFAPVQTVKMCDKLLSVTPWSNDIIQISKYNPWMDIV